MTIDLHTHSSASDGTDAPAELMTAAAAAGVRVMALTDHDTTAGWAPAAAARPDGLTLIRGAEFSTLLPVDGYRVSVHVLGYLFDPDHPAVVSEHTRLRAERMDRGMAIVERMVAAGVPISADQVLQIAGDATVGRPHIGRALVQAGLVATVSEAFTSYLSGRGPYYVPKADTDLATAIALIGAAGGVSVVAHPRSRGAYGALTAATLGRLADLGLHGIEVDHPDHAAADRAQLREIAGRLGLIVTGSSDYHGTNKSLRLGQEQTDPDQLARIVQQSSGVTRPLGPLPQRA